jgi:hypothetical protein
MPDQREIRLFAPAHDISSHCRKIAGARSEMMFKPRRLLIAKIQGC